MADLPQPVRDPAGTVLVVLDDTTHREHADQWLEDVGYRVVLADSLDDARARIASRLDLDLVLADSHYGDGQGNVIDAAAEAPEGLAVILVGPGDVIVATHAMARGAAAFLPYPLQQEDLLVAVGRALHVARRARLVADARVARPAIEDVAFEGLVGTSPRMLEVMETLRKAAPTDAPVLIQGESGTGKELVAQAIHASSRRRDKPFVAMHLRAISAGLVESELFGHKKGAFTGATGDRTGKLELADGGTLFLDELGDIPLDTQVKLLRVLETRTFEPVGSNRPVTSDFRLISATNLNIPELIEQGTFREELYYRLNVIRVSLPPLRERQADVSLLVERFIREVSARYGRPVQGIEPDALAVLKRYPWPGNIRELLNVVQHMVVLADGETLRLRDVPRELRGETAVASGAGLAGRTMDEIERDAIQQTLDMTGGNRKEAAKLLGIGERTLYRKIEKYDL